MKPYSKPEAYIAHIIEAYFQVQVVGEAPGASQDRDSARDRRRAASDSESEAGSESVTGVTVPPLAVWHTPGKGG